MSLRARHEGWPLHKLAPGRKAFFAISLREEDQDHGLGGVGYSVNAEAPGSGRDAPPKFGPRAANRVILPAWLSWLVERFGRTL